MTMKMTITMESNKIMLQNVSFGPVSIYEPAFKFVMVQ